LEEHFPGDIFAGSDKSRLWIERSRGGMSETVVEAEREPYLDGPPLGFELAPSNTIRHSRHDRKSGRILYDGVCTTNEHGFRTTRGNDAAEATFIFLGCSVTFGYGLSDDQTMPHRFSESLLFGQRVLNLAVSNYGPHHALRELETNRHAGRAGVNPEKVKAVFYGLIDDHARRAVHPSTPSTPRYVLESGVLRNAGNFMDSPLWGRLSLMMARSRVYPALRDKFAAGESEYKWELTYAILSEMDSICRVRYGVGLTVVYWDENPEVMKRMEEAGIHTIDVNAAFDGEASWRAWPVKYCLFDGHPSAYANMRLGRYLAGLFSDP
jgi:hypothetical protein